MSEFFSSQERVTSRVVQSGVGFLTLASNLVYDFGMFRVVKPLVAGFVVSVVLGGCTAGSALQEIPEASQSAIDEQPIIQDGSQLEVDPNVSAEAVVLAAILVANGDAAAAVEQGLVSPVEVEAAIKAIADGTLQEWVNLAES